MPTHEEITEAMLWLDQHKPEHNINQLHRSGMGLWAVLTLLQKQDKPLSSKEISTALGVSSARMTVLLKKMEQESLIDKKNYPNDGRKVLISLSPEGKEKAQSLTEKKYHCTAAILEIYSLSQLKDLFQQLNNIHGIIQTHLQDEIPIRKEE